MRARRRAAEREGRGSSRDHHPVARRKRVAVGIVAALVTALAPAALRARDGQTSRPQGPTHPAAVNVPGLVYPVYVLPVGPKDDRTPRQRCWDGEIARLGTPVTELDRRTIDLKCSQR